MSKITSTPTYYSEVEVTTPVDYIAVVDAVVITPKMIHLHFQYLLVVSGL